MYVHYKTGNSKVISVIFASLVGLSAEVERGDFFKKLTWLRFADELIQSLLRGCYFSPCCETAGEL